MAVTRGDDGSQGTLFDDSEVPGLPGGPGAASQPGISDQPGTPGLPGVDSADIGYRGPTACAAAGITYRQLDYWARTCLLYTSPSPRD